MVGGGDDRACFIELTPPISVDMAMAIERAAKTAFGREVIFNSWWSLSDLRTDFGGPWAKRI